MYDCCPICRSRHTSPVGFESQQPIGHYEIHHCEDCGHRYLASQPDDGTLSRFYDEIYEADPRHEVRLAPAWRDRPLARRITEHLPDEARVLEIGSGFGQTLLALPNSFIREGVELSESAYRATAADPRLRIHHGFFERLHFEEAAYDAVIALALIEHLRDARAFLERVARLLRPGGIAVLMTGDYGSWFAERQGREWPLYHCGGHFHFFSQQSLTRGLEAARLEPFQWIWAGPGPLTSRLPNPLGRLLYCQTTSLAVPWIQGRRRYGDAMYVWARAV